MPTRYRDNLLLDNLSTAVMLLDAKLRIQYLNPAAEMLLEFSGTRSLGLSVEHLLMENGKPLTEMAQTLETRRPYTKRQVSLTLSSGQTISVDYTVTPVQMNAADHLLLEFQPLDRLLKISREASLLSTQETSRTLIRGLAHEIKNPLGGLRGAAQLLAKELPDESLKDYTDIIIAEADRLRKLVDRLLGPNKLPEQKPVNIHEVIERVISLIFAETGGRIDFKRDYDPSIPDLLGDKGKLIQALLNIVRNAMQAFPDDQAEQPQILLQTRVLRQFTLGDHHYRLACRVDIVDNGPGIDAELVQTIFFPMVSGRAEGTGLGLSIAQSIVNQHKGLIECSSEPGETRFTIYLPLELNHEST
jgi:two-component system nitrogen regulation sensor histidine kinase GlnL